MLQNSNRPYCRDCNTQVVAAQFAISRPQTHKCKANWACPSSFARRMCATDAASHTCAFLPGFCHRRWASWPAPTGQLHPSSWRTWHVWAAASSPHLRQHTYEWNESTVMVSKCPGDWPAGMGMYIVRRSGIRFWQCRVEPNHATACCTCVLYHIVHGTGLAKRSGRTHSAFVEPTVNVLLPCEVVTVQCCTSTVALFVG